MKANIARLEKQMVFLRELFKYNSIESGWCECLLLDADFIWGHPKFSFESKNGKLALVLTLVEEKEDKTNINCYVNINSVATRYTVTQRMDDISESSLKYFFPEKILKDIKTHLNAD